MVLFGIILGVIMGSIFMVPKILVTNQLKSQRVYDKGISSKFDREKKGYETYLKELNLKSDESKYLKKIKKVHCVKELLDLIKTAESESKNNTKNDEKGSENSIKYDNDIPKQSFISSSKTKDEKQFEISDNPLQSSSCEQENNQISESPEEQVSSNVKDENQLTDGFNFNGKHYDISTFSGLGHVPVDNSIYQWLDYTEHLHLLAERQSPIGKDIRELSIGSKIIVNNRSYTIYNIISGVPNDYNTYKSLSNGQPALTIQSCDSGAADSTLTIWYAS